MKPEQLVLTIRLAATILLSALAACALPVRAETVRGAPAPAQAAVEQWGVFELTLKGPADGNPFTEVELSARFTQGERAITATGFYDGEGVYKVRFMPDVTGEWRYVTSSNRQELADKTGAFTATPPTKGNHGPVRVAHTFHFAYADGTPFRQVGTTCYTWTYQSDAMEEQTLRTLAKSPFNKVRFLVFPAYDEGEGHVPPRYPFQGTPPKQWDFARFNPDFFRHFEQRVAQLRDLGIEADIILFHPYDRGQWGFDLMPAEADERYVRYVVARLAAYRNVWWSLANEFDHLLATKPTETWARYFQIVQSSDPYHRLRSIHQNNIYYDHNKPWVTHASIQNSAAVQDFGRAMLLRNVYRKPIVFDEIKYEGDMALRWGNLSAEQMVLQFWMSAVAGTYAGHGETYASEGHMHWFSQGGVMKGQSPPRLAFLRKILEEGPAEGLDPLDKWMTLGTGAQPGEYYLIYFGADPRTEWKFELFHSKLSAGMKFAVDVIDTWNMTIAPVDGLFELKRSDAYNFADKDGRSVPLPGKPYMAVRVRLVGTTPAVSGEPDAEPQQPALRV
ncbi:MAG: DUF5060 domain-containing protein, partial [Vicinamibacterales bacterium]|nr:DUF5060 domain-containing protein [Vicinamibacterales bacterium]